MDIQALNFKPPDAPYWPWGIVIGWPLAVALWFFGRKAAGAPFPRAALSFAIACAVAPTIVNYGDRPFLIHAFTMLRHVFSTDRAQRRTGAIAATPPIVIFSLFLFVIWSIVKRRPRYPV